MVDLGAVATNEYPYDHRATFPSLPTPTLSQDWPATATAFTPPPSSTPLSSPTPTATWTASPTPLPDQNAAYAPYQVDMASYGPNGGWIELHGRYFWTTDQGASWTEFAIPERPGFMMVELAFVDDREAWAVWISEEDIHSYDQSRLEIYRSTDRGNNWEAVQFERDPIDDYARFAFYDLEVYSDNVFWIAADTTQTMNSHRGELVRTTNGGQTWLLSDLPYSGSVEFISPNVGWTTGSCCTGAPKMLFRTLDGGETWQEQVLVPDPVDDQFSYNHYSLPVFLNATNGVITVELKDADYQDIGIAVFYTADGGYNWTLARRIEDFNGLVFAIEMITKDTWVIRGADDNFITFDGGKWWQRVNAPQVSEGSYIGTMMFDAYGYGWVMAHTETLNRPERQHYLYTTEDWGKSWEAFDSRELTG